MKKISNLTKKQWIIIWSSLATLVVVAIVVLGTVGMQSKADDDSDTKTTKTSLSSSSKAVSSSNSEQEKKSEESSDKEEKQATDKSSEQGTALTNNASTETSSSSQSVSTGSTNSGSSYQAPVLNNGDQSAYSQDTASGVQQAPTASAPASQPSDSNTKRKCTGWVKNVKGQIIWSGQFDTMKEAAQAADDYSNAHTWDEGDMEPYSSGCYWFNIKTEHGNVFFLFGRMKYTASWHCVN